MTMEKYISHTNSWLSLTLWWYQIRSEIYDLLPYMESSQDHCPSSFCERVIIVAGRVPDAGLIASGHHLDLYILTT